MATLAAATATATLALAVTLGGWGHTPASSHHAAALQAQAAATLALRPR